MIRRRTQALHGSIFSWMVLLGASGCTNLDFLTPDQCGNWVVETDIGEDCDGGNGCGAPNSPHACRYVCDTADKSCPTELGYQCGADAVCRKPKGTFFPTSTDTTVSAEDMLVGDINVDGCAEVVISAIRSTSLYAYSSPFSTSCVDSQQTLTTNRPDMGTMVQSTLPLPELAYIDTTDTTKRLSLLSPTKGLFGEGLSMGFTSGPPTLLPVLFPRFLRGGSQTRTVAATMRKSGVIVLFESAAKATKSDVTLLFDSQQAPQTFPGAYPAGVDDIVGVVATDIDPVVNSADNMLCDEIVIAKKGASKLAVYKLCSNGMTNGFSEMANSEITLTNATARDNDSTIFAVDANGDKFTDIVLSAKDQKAHVAYGFGDGRFHSLPPTPMPPPIFDQKANALNDPMADEAAKDGRVFTAFEYDPMHPGIDFYGPPCPSLEVFSSPNCAPVTGGCEGVVSDIDADGDMDVVVSEGQGVDLAIHRQTNHTFNVTFLPTECPPHHLGSGDFDGDGVNDIAFFDQTSKGAGQNTTSLSIVYGNAFAAPDQPLTSGRYDAANGLSVVQFSPPGSGAQIAITRSVGPMNMQGSAIGVVEVGSERTVVAPYYITADIMGTAALDSLTLLAQTVGKFGPNGMPGLAVLTNGSSGIHELWLIQTNADSGSLRATPRNDSTDVPCDNGCLLAAIPRPNATDDLLVLGDGTSTLYTVATDHFQTSTTFAAKHSFRPIVPNSTAMQFVTKYYPRPLVTDIDHDGQTDVLALATSGAFVGFFGNADGSFTEIELASAPSCWDATTGWGQSGCANYVATEIDVDGDGILDLVLAGSELPQIEKSMSVAAYRVENRSLRKIQGVSIAAEPLRSDSDFISIAAADMDSDGVRDLIYMPSSNYFTVLRGLPVHE